jgi:mannose-6-phosphate isomerase-like protein (cupin superfamily)
MKIINFDEVAPLPNVDSELKFFFPKEANLLFHVLVMKDRQKFPAHMHRVGTEIYYVASGKGFAKVGSEEKAIRSGDCILIPPKNYHSISHQGKAPLVIVAVRVPNIPSDSYRLEKGASKDWHKMITGHIRNISEMESTKFAKSSRNLVQRTAHHTKKEE